MSWHTKAAWDEEDYVFFSVPSEQGPDMETVVRFTVGTCNELDVGTFRKLMREVEDYVDERYSFDFFGKTMRAGLLSPKQIQTLTPDQAEIYQRGIVAYDVLTKWATIKAGLRAIAAQDVPVGDSPVDDGWEVTEWPTDWDDLDLFLNSAPATLISNLFGAINAMNPNIFSTRIGYTEKKIPRVNRGSFRTLPKPLSTRKNGASEEINLPTTN